MAKLKVKMLETTYYEGANYERGKTYTMDEGVAAALGSSVEVVHRVKDAGKAPEDTMVGKPPAKK